ncbi:ribonuclease Z [Cytophagales bacterium LB-30]|uniref:Ribonuclease Z n=1 Tax=Shiella aurantiaca TaxID=3058365 RepID=A0ABT8F428_9BACT|nr:ribonuclease Z [Shiella aurantiaca]MDN4165211.1 ribonuclease Z [Shiella aurantiaca]
MALSVKILGASAAAPAHHRHQTAQLLTANGSKYLIDCGEGTQMQLTRYKEKLASIHHIFISHLHGDHYLGLMGILSSQHLLGRTKALHLFGPPDLRELILVNLRISQTLLNFDIIFHPLEGESGKLIFEDKQVEVYQLKMNHRIACYGFMFQEKPKRYSLRKEKLPAGLSLQEIALLVQGKDIYDTEGQLAYRASDLTKEPPVPVKYAYCADTAYHEEIIPWIEGAHGLYHEATFMQDMAARAKETFHSTTIQAATLAQKAKVHQLIIGHYSIRYKDLTPLLAEAQTVFPNTRLAIEGESIVFS